VVASHRCGLRVKAALRHAWPLVPLLILGLLVALSLFPGRQRARIPHSPSAPGPVPLADRSIAPHNSAAHPRGKQAAEDPRPNAPPPDGYSNIAADDYVGPEACNECHEDKFKGWASTLHRTMNQLASAESVLGDFSAQALTYGPRRVVFERRDEKFFMSYYSGDRLTRRFRVTRTIGSRYVQEYAGLQVEGPEPKTHPIYRDEIKLPFGYWLRQKGWFPSFYYDPDITPEYSPDGRPLLNPFAELDRFGDSCVYCHNTYAYATRLNPSPELAGNVQGFDALQLREPPPPAANVEHKLVTVGISCESCHFGGREHSIEAADIRFVPTSPDLQWVGDPPLHSSANKNPMVLNAICRQCHLSTIGQRYPNLAAAGNSNESGDLASGECGPAISCVACHDPHEARAPRGQQGDDRYVAACLNCHTQFSTPAKRGAHSRHAEAAKVSCLDCHMPRITGGLTDYVRSHQISSPTDTLMLQAGMPNACNLCHLDRSMAWTLDSLAKGWGTKIEAKPHWRAIYGETLQLPVGPMWLSHKSGFVRSTAAAAYASSPDSQESRQRVLALLNDPIAFFRMRAVIEYERILGRRLTKREFSPLAPPEVRRAQLAKLRAEGR
jgi:hypothetical protein